MEIKWKPNSEQIHFKWVFKGEPKTTMAIHTVPQAQLGFFNCPKHSDHAKNFVGPLEKF